jgi:HD superfamily phosphohydrolase
MLRDPKSSGLPELCSFDYIRIINLITPIKQEKIIGESTYTFYVPGFDRRALSSLTDFFNDRVRQYRWLTNHHNVVKTDMVMTRLIILLADLYDEVSNDNNHPISSYLHDNHFESLWNWTNLHQDYRYVDDAWLDTLLLGLLKKVLSISNDENFDNYRSDIEECEILLKVLYDRKNYLLKPLWKRIDDFIPFATEFSQQFQINVKRKFNGIKKKEDRDQLHPSISKFYVEEDVEVDEIFYTNQILEQWSKNTFNLSPYSKMKRVENRISEDFPDIRFVLKIVIPYKEVLMLMKDETIKPLHKLSNLVANLSSISKNDLMLYAYVMNTNENNYDSNIDLCFLGKKMADALFQLFLEDQKKDSRS